MNAPQPADLDDAQVNLSFLSDNASGVCPPLMDAINEANRGFATPYGQDDWTKRLDSVLSHFFEAPVRAFPVVSGTAANALAIASLTSPFDSIFAHRQAHTHIDECGAPEFFSSGARVVGLPGEGGKLIPATLAAALEAARAQEFARPTVLSIAQATEFGTVYSVAELSALCALARANGLRVHMDGARFANALVSQGCRPADLTWRAGVDALSFGATKNGALAAEAVVFFNAADAHDFAYRLKRSGHQMAKARYVSAQLICYVESEVWRENAAWANARARQLAAGAATRLVQPVEANEVFLRLTDAEKVRLRSAGFDFHDWDEPGSDIARFVMSWNQPEAEVAALGAALKPICGLG